MTPNSALADEVEALNSIYNVDTLSITTNDDVSTTSVLNLPDLPFSFNVTFPNQYPDAPPQLDGTQSTGPNTKKGDGESALNILRDVLGSIYTPGQVCLFDLIEEVTPLLRTSTSHSTSDALEECEQSPTEQDNNTDDNNLYATNGEATTSSQSATHQPPTADLSNLHIGSLVPPATTGPEPDWILSTPLLVSKSSFIARAGHITTLSTAKSAISHLLSTNKKVASATHNITAWRIRSTPPTPSSSTKTSNDATHEIIIQDCDDDGETAAGGRLLHLMQLMDAWNCVVVVTRWYGGVKLGPDRFRCINMVARDALVRGGFAKQEEERKETKSAKGKKGHKGG